MNDAPRPRSWRAWALVLTACLVACTPSASAPLASDGPSVPATLVALESAARDPLAAEAWLLALDRAASPDDDDYALVAAAAALDALVLGEEPFGPSGADHAIVHRSAPHMVLAADYLQRFHRRARNPFVRSLIAEALHALALRVGAFEALRWRARTGCVERAALAGPVAWPPLSALAGESPLAPGSPFPAAVAGIAPFAKNARFEAIHADACMLDVDATSPLRGERLLVVDAPGLARELFLAITSSAAVRVEVGGKPVLERPFDDGPRASTHFARVAVSAGRTRIVVRIAQRGDAHTLGLRVLDAQGEPAKLEIPPEGTVADAQLIRARAVDWPAADSDPRRIVVAAGALALGRAREAMELLDQVSLGAGHVDLLRMRALEASSLLPRNQLRQELEALVTRAEGSCADCWPVKLAAATVAQERRGFATGGFAALEALGVDEMGFPPALGAVALARIAELARASDLHDLARRAHDQLAAAAPGSAIAADVDWLLHRRAGDDLEQAACEGGTSRASTRCFHARASRGRLEPAIDELDRLRTLRGSQSLHRDLELELLVTHGEIDRAMRLYEVLSPAERSLALLGALADRADAKARFTRDMRRAADAPQAFEPLVRHFGVVGDPAAAFDRSGAALVARDRAEAFLPGAGTAVLRRVERYQVDETGLLHYAIYDLRRVSDTVDVAGGTWMGLPMVDGRHTSRALRRRIYKRDGRVVDPDPNVEGAQGDTDLSSLEANDYVEALVVGWALPDASGQLVVDTPDLMPLRTSLREAEIRFTRPKALPLSLWRHDSLGEGATREEGAKLVTTYRLQNRSPRRLEEGVAPLEERVAMSFGTDSWSRIARALAERYAALDEDLPFMRRWAEGAVGDEKDVTRRVMLVTAAAGKAIPEADPSALSDFAAAMGGGGQRETARFIIERGTGSRSWVIHRALRALGIHSTIVVAENRPFSAAPDFPPRVGRFVRPLVWVEQGDVKLWIDADVEGPVLPPGRVSPELRGRLALRADGEMIAVGGLVAPDADTIDIRLRLEPDGTAEGTFTALLHGRAAQRLAEAFHVVVGSARQELLRNVVLGWLPWADVRAVTLSSEPGSWQVAIRADIAFVGFARPESRDGKIRTLPGLEPLHEVFPYPRTSTIGAVHAGQSGRSAALSIAAPSLYTLRRTIELPPGTKLLRSPGALRIEGALLSAKRTFEHEGDVVTETFDLDLSAGTVAPSEYDEFAARARRVDDGFQHGVQIELP